MDRRSDLIQTAATVEAAKARFNSKWIEDPETGCWNWTGATIGKGYGQVQIRSLGKDKYAHRWAWRFWKGALSDGDVVCHRCDNRMCVNPDHLFVGSRADNQTDMANKDRSLFGEKNSQTKLTERQVYDMHELVASGAPRAEVAKRFGVRREGLDRIIRGERWRRVYNAFHRLRDTK
jgi:hypothetical protein